MQKKAQLEASPLNVNKVAERGEMERKIDLIQNVLKFDVLIVQIIYNYKDC